MMCSGGGGVLFALCCEEEGDKNDVEWGIGEGVCKCRGILSEHDLDAVPKMREFGPKCLRKKNCSCCEEVKQGKEKRNAKCVMQSSCISHYP